MNSFAKIIEKAIHVRLYDFLDGKNKVITEKQYAYRKKKSLQDALYELTEDIYKAVDNKKIIVSAYVDVKKAFDSVDKKF